MTYSIASMKTFAINALLLILSSAVSSPAMAAEATQTPEIVCIQCHSSLPGGLGEPVRLWRDSIHAENEISCNDCHGGDPKDAANAMSPERGFIGAPKETDIPAFCGRCHVGVEKDYAESAHGRALGKGGPTCVTCHGNHLVLRASLDIINEERCGRCHSYERARTIRGAMAKTEGEILSIGSRLEFYKERGVDTARLEKELFASRNGFHSLFHSVDVRKVRDDSSRISAELKVISDTLSFFDKRERERKVAGAGVVALALAAALLFHLLKKSYL